LWISLLLTCFHSDSQAVKPLPDRQQQARHDMDRAVRERRRFA
jgi:hypothetical protein